MQKTPLKSQSCFCRLFVEQTKSSPSNVVGMFLIITRLI